MKATFIRKYHGHGFDRNTTYLEYEYRGTTYVVCENNAKGNEPLSWQHKAEQNRIDKIIDAPKQSGEAVDMDEIWKLFGWD